MGRLGWVEPVASLGVGMWPERGQGDGSHGRWEGVLWFGNSCLWLSWGQDRGPGKQWGGSGRHAGVRGWAGGVGGGEGTGWLPAVWEWSLQALGQIPWGRHWEEAGGSLG